MRRSVSFGVSAVIIAIASGVSSRNAFAIVATFDSAAAYDSASKNNSTIDFANYQPDSIDKLSNYSTASGLTANGVTFTGPMTSGQSYFLYTISPAYFPSYQGYDGNPTSLQGPSGGASDGPGYINITLAAGTTSLAFDVFTVTNGAPSQSGPGTIDITVDGTSYSINTPGNPNLGFFGFTSTSPISSLQLSDFRGQQFP